MAGNVKSIIYVTNGIEAANVHKKKRTAHVSACGQVSEWCRPRNDAEVALIESVRLLDEE
jgi:hypothetical protein